MDTRLFEAAQGGNIDYLQRLLTENPLILNITLLSAENPLNIAADMGHVDFVKEIIKLKPVFAKEVNQEGFSPTHIAAANGHVEIVKELMKVDIKLCRLEGGRQKMTPLHYAAIKGRAEVISAMLSDCPDCIVDETVRKENAFHLAVKNNRFEAIKILGDWIKDMNKEYLLNMKDEQGNTVLHLASWKKQREVLEMLLGSGTVSSGSLEVNAINNSGLTALDMVLIFPSEAGDREIVEILRSAGATRRDIIHSTIPNNQTSTDNPPTPERCLSNRNNLVEYFKFKRGRDSPSEARSTLLVIAVLVATATFQVGVNPPGGVWQDTNIPDHTNSTSSSNAHFAGQSILATTEPVGFMLFVFFNSVGFSMSLYMIYVLKSEFPLQFELRICLLAMYCTCGTALPCIVPSNLYVSVLLTTTPLSSTTSALARGARPLATMLKKFSRTSLIESFEVDGCKIRLRT